MDIKDEKDFEKQRGTAYSKLNPISHRRYD